MPNLIFSGPTGTAEAQTSLFTPSGFCYFVPVGVDGFFSVRLLIALPDGDRNYPLLPDQPRREIQLAAQWEVLPIPAALVGSGHQCKLGIKSRLGSPFIEVWHSPTGQDSMAASSVLSSSHTIDSTTPLIIAPPSPQRLSFTIWHESEEDLLISFGDTPLTAQNYALALPGFHLLENDLWRGKVRALARSGAIAVSVREFLP
jgi:hypothetical protein